MLGFIAITLWLGSMSFALGVAYADEVKAWIVGLLPSPAPTEEARTAIAEQDGKPAEAFSAAPGRKPWSVRRRELEKQYAVDSDTEEAD